MLHDERRQQRRRRRRQRRQRWTCAIYSQYTHLCRYIRSREYVCASAALNADVYATHTYPPLHVHVRVHVHTAHVAYVGHKLHGGAVHSLPQSVPGVAEKERNKGRLKTIIPRYHSNVTRTHAVLTTETFWKHVHDYSRIQSRYSVTYGLQVSFFFTVLRR